MAENDQNEGEGQQSDQNQQNQLNIELPEDVAEGIYSNLAIITHSHSEFVLDFIRVLPGTPKSKVKARVLLTPHHAKKLQKALDDNLSKYEATHGSIEEPPEAPDEGGIPMNFGGPTAKA